MGYEEASSICEGCGWSMRNCHCGEDNRAPDSPAVNRCACGQVIVSYETQCGPCYDRQLKTQNHR